MEPETDKKITTGESDDTDDTIKIKDSLDRMQIEQLHNATLNFSNSCIETKKLYVTVMIAVFTVFAAIYEEELASHLTIILGFEIVVTFFFWIVDSVFYYYQSKLRKQMGCQVKKIEARHNIREESKSTESAPTESADKIKSGLTAEQVVKSFTNMSQTMYKLFAILLEALLIVLLIAQN